MADGVPEGEWLDARGSLGEVGGGRVDAEEGGVTFPRKKREGDTARL